jgi:hypothetical protein
MGGRGPQSFKKRQKEQARKEKQQEKVAKRLERKKNPTDVDDDVIDPGLDYGPRIASDEDLPASLLGPSADSR